MTPTPIPVQAIIEFTHENIGEWVAIGLAILTGLGGWITTLALVRKTKADSREKEAAAKKIEADAIAATEKIKLEAATAGSEAASTVIRELSSRVSALHDDIMKADERYETLERRFRDTQNKLDDTMESLKRTRVALKEAEANQILNLARVVQLEADLKTVQSSAVAKGQENEKRVTSLATENETLRVELGELRASYEKERNEWAVEREQLQQKIGVLEKIVAELRLNIPIGGFNTGG
jgi:chromosome segregation ATPase